jgi:phosphatidylserine decarboxylase
MDVYYIDRKTKEKKKERIPGDLFLRWTYHTKLGNSALELLVKRKLFSSIYGKLQDISISRRKIKKFVQTFSIDMAEAEREEFYDYRTFNDFFTRRLKSQARPICLDKKHLVSPADGRVLAYENIDIDGHLEVKGSLCTLKELIQDDQLAIDYQGGTCMIVRLSPVDYHRFHFPDNGIPVFHRKIKGSYYAVNPLAIRKKINVYCKNKRELTLFDSENFGEMLLIEVGATCVGSIVQTYKEKEPVRKGQEKGYFKFGGSTVIMLLKSGILKVDEDILDNTSNKLETKVYMGETVGKRKRDN